MIMTDAKYVHMKERVSNIELLGNISMVLVLVAWYIRIYANNFIQFIKHIYLPVYLVISVFVAICFFYLISFFAWVERYYFNVHQL